MLYKHTLLARRPSNLKVLGDQTNSLGELRITTWRIQFNIMDLARFDSKGVARRCDQGMWAPLMTCYCSNSIINRQLLK